MHIGFWPLTYWGAEVPLETDPIVPIAQPSDDSPLGSASPPIVHNKTLKPNKIRLAAVSRQSGAYRRLGSSHLIPGDVLPTWIIPIRWPPANIQLGLQESKYRICRGGCCDVMEASLMPEETRIYLTSMSPLRISFDLDRQDWKIFGNNSCILLDTGTEGFKAGVLPHAVVYSTFLRLLAQVQFVFVCPYCVWSCILLYSAQFVQYNKLLEVQWSRYHSLYKHVWISFLLMVESLSPDKMLYVLWEWLHWMMRHNEEPRQSWLLSSMVYSNNCYGDFRSSTEDDISTIGKNIIQTFPIVRNLVLAWKVIYERAHICRASVNCCSKKNSTD